MPFGSGSILPSTVKAVKKGTCGSAGELRGDFDLTGGTGAAVRQHRLRHFRHGEQHRPSGRQGRRCRWRQAAAGPAVIRSNVSGDEVRDYEVEILKIIPDAADGREMVLSVTDPELIAATGGIVQGMSGSPVIQNGRLVGAVTHVLLSAPTKGYGISVETMLETGSPV